MTTIRSFLAPRTTTVHIVFSYIVLVLVVPMIVPTLVSISLILVPPMLVVPSSILVPTLPMSLASQEKEILFPKDTPPFPSNFEIESSIHPFLLTRTPQKNKGHNTKCSLEILEATLLIDEDAQLVHVSPPLMEKYFYPLSDTDREEGVRRKVTIVPLSIISRLPALTI